MLVGYDLDGVLCQPPPQRGKKWGMCNGEERRAWLKYMNDWYLKVAPLYDPPEWEFRVLTARKGNDPAVRLITEVWLHKHFGNRIVSLHMLTEARSVGASVAFKAEAIKLLEIPEYTEDNLSVVRGIARRCPDTKVFAFNPETQERVLQFVKNR